MEKSIRKLLLTLTLSTMAFSISNAMETDATMDSAGEVCVAPPSSPSSPASSSTIEPYSHHEGISALATRALRVFRVLPPEILLKKGREKRENFTIELRKQRRAHSVNMHRFSTIGASTCSYHRQHYCFVDETWAQLPRTAGFVFVINNIPYFIPTTFVGYLAKKCQLPIDLSRPLTHVYIEFPELSEQECNFILDPTIVIPLLRIMQVGCLDEANPEAHISEAFSAKFDILAFMGEIMTHGSIELGSEDAVQSVMEKVQSIRITHV